MSIKLDMSKAYDRDEWDFSERILSTMGFSICMVQSIMQCVKTIYFSILVNGSPKGPILPSRGQRQGDPLSPYLFLLCSEGLVFLLKQSATTKCLEGVKVCRGATSINYLLFADDSLIFCRASWEASLHLLVLQKKYALTSGSVLIMTKPP